MPPTRLVCPNRRDSKACGAISSPLAMNLWGFRQETTEEHRHRRTPVSPKMRGLSWLGLQGGTEIPRLPVDACWYRIPMPQRGSTDWGRTPATGNWFGFNLVHADFNRREGAWFRPTMGQSDAPDHGHGGGGRYRVDDQGRPWFLMMSREPQIRWSDAWLLTATYLASRQAPADLADILGAADLLNRAVPNPEELESGLFRLHERGWVTQVGEDLRFQPTAEAVEMIEELSSEKKSAYDVWKALEASSGSDFLHTGGAFAPPGQLLLLSRVHPRGVPGGRRAVHEADPIPQTCAVSRRPGSEGLAARRYTRLARAAVAQVDRAEVS